MSLGAEKKAPGRPPLAYRAESDEAQVQMGSRQWRIRGIGKNTTPGILRLNLLVRTETGFFVDSLDLYSARHRASFLQQAASELCVEERLLKADLGKLLLSLEELQEKLDKEAQQARTRGLWS